ncbi:SDR family oxidoreductase [Aquabacterium sp. A3]|uniref:SDR family oxidoreductase n=1 Tax=Aquabacterium sp. A3 TaxID=3132829 RepID=UPI0031195003
MQRKTALVTGGSAGIGKETVKALVAQGYEVLIAARDARKGLALVAQLRRDTPGAQVDFIACDLSEFGQVVALAQAVQARWTQLDALVLNAGLFTPQLRCNSAGYEFMFATTHLGHFLLTHHLLPLVLAAPDARVVVTSSVAHWMGGGFDFDSLRSPSTRSLLMLVPFRAYGRSKLANLLFVRELARRVGGTSVKVNAFHPGPVNTEIWRDTPSLFNTLIRPGLISEAAGARTQIQLVTAPGLRESGGYWARGKLDYSSPASRNRALAAQLWQYSEQALGITRFGQPADDTGLQQSA